MVSPVVGVSLLIGLNGILFGYALSAMPTYEKSEWDGEFERGNWTPQSDHEGEGGGGLTCVYTMDDDRSYTCKTAPDCQELLYVGSRIYKCGVIP